jgi:hypothetical protein
LESDVSLERYQTAADQRRIFLQREEHFKPIAQHENATTPVLLDNVLLFMVEQAIAAKASAVMCTEPHRCPLSNPTTLWPPRKTPRECLWYLSGTPYTVNPKQWLNKDDG